MPAYDLASKFPETKDMGHRDPMVALVPDEHFPASPDEQMRQAVDCLEPVALHRREYRVDLRLVARRQIIQRRCAPEPFPTPETPRIGFSE